MKLLLVFFAALFLISCAHHRDVRPGVDGVHTVKVRNEATEGGERDALSQANHYCEKRQLSAAFLKEESKYTGDVDEETYKTAKTVGNVAKSVGGAVMVFGGKTERDLGGLGVLGGGATDAALGKGYTTEMKFKCQ